MLKAIIYLVVLFFITIFVLSKGNDKSRSEILKYCLLHNQYFFVNEP